MSKFRLILHFLFCLVLILDPQGIFAADEKKIEAATDKFREGPCYLNGWCHDNVLRFLEADVLTFEDLQEAHVLVIVPTSGDRTLASFATGHGTKLWKYHVVLELRGQIIDFSMEAPRVRTFQNYFKQMFHIQKPEQLMAVVIVPAMDYLVEMGRLDPQGRSVSINYYLTPSMTQTRYERVDAKNLVKNTSLPRKTSIYSAIEQHLSRIVISWKMDSLVWRKDKTIAVAWVERGEMDVHHGDAKEIMPEALKGLEERASKDPVIQRLFRKFVANKYNCSDFLD